MLQKSHSLTATWLCLFLYSGLFTLLQEVLFPPLHLPGDLTVIVCACLAALPILCYGARTSTCKLYPANAQRLSILTFFYLFSLDFILNLTVSLSSPLIERILRLLGIGLREAPIPNGSTSPLLAFYICLLGPILEELIYRGIVLQKLLLRPDAPRLLSRLIRLPRRHPLRLYRRPLLTYGIHRPAYPEQLHGNPAAYAQEFRDSRSPHHHSDFSICLNLCSGWLYLGHTAQIFHLSGIDHFPRLSGRCSDAPHAVACAPI